MLSAVHRDKNRLGMTSALSFVLGHGEPHALTLLVIHGVEFLKEGDAKNKQRPIRRWYIETHQRNLADAVCLIDVISGFKVEDMPFHDKAKVGKLCKICA